MTPFWEQPLSKLDRAQWEALCDGCGKCCLHKVEDADSGEIHATNVACRLLDRDAGMCSDYKHRHAYVAECVRLNANNVDGIAWLPRSCAYRLRANGEPLPHWHYLLTGSRESVHEAGESTRGWTISEDVAGDLVYHMVDRIL